MNEFLEQFIVESRELVEQATAALLILERSAHDEEGRDALFRSLHTLKGGASIVDFAAMERVVHSAEDVLSAARSGKHAIGPELIAGCLSCLDQVTRWLDSIEKSGDLPPHAEQEASVLIRRIGGLAGDAVDSSASASPAMSGAWVDRILERNKHLTSQVATAVRWIPQPDSFFRGEDPLALFGTLPGLLSMSVEPIREWPPLAALDPFESILSLTGLTASASRDVHTHLKNCSGDCEVVALTPEPHHGAGPGLPQSAQRVLDAQLLLLSEVDGGDFPGRVGSAGAVAGNVLRYCGRPADAERIRQATERSLGEKNAAPLREQIGLMLSPEPSSNASAPPQDNRSETVARTLRVDAARVDELVRLTGELTVIKNAIGHAALLAQADDNPLANGLKIHHGVLDHVTGEMQRAVLSMRVLPLRSVLQRLPRIVREMSASLNKSVRMVIEGDETEADKAIVEMLFEPLLHIVRNAMDHGIEDPATRERRGKASVATIRVRASRLGEQVVIEVEDDGEGIDVARVRAVARQRAVVPSDSLEAMTDPEVLDLVFAPGFSTASRVTELSGRGVGMDAVRQAVARVGGRVSIDSRAGQGTTVRFELPFSVMMTHVMTVEAAGQMFGIPLDAVVETIRIPVDSIAGVGSARAIVRRDRTIPVFDLADLLSVGNRTARNDLEVFVVIASFAGQLTGIQVDSLGERMEIMLKPLDGLLSRIPGITGTTILGDGRVLLVLDLEGVLQ